MRARIHFTLLLLTLSIMLTGCKFVECGTSGQQLTIDVFGDSYVRNHRRPYEETWHYKACKELGIGYNNHGRNGSCVAFDRSKEGFGPAMTMRSQELDPTADLVIIIAGHNDAHKIGDDPEKLSQFKDSASELIDLVRAQCPKAKIGWVTPWYVDHAGFSTTVKAIKQICKAKHVPVLDNYKSSSIIRVRDVSFRKQYFQGENDMAHLNSNGHDLYLKTGEKFIKKILDF